MIEHDTDILVIGSGFGGSIMALLLARMGRSVVVVDRAAHPRFAIGESSTPIADAILRDLADRYDLDWLRPLAAYGSWRQAHPELTCGRKRGFSYFRQRPGQPFAPQADHANELLVAASSEDKLADTHWLRSDVDQFLAGKLRDAAIPLVDRTQIKQLTHDAGWTAEGEREEERVRLSARFVVDASGAGQFLPRALGLSCSATNMATNSRAIYGHFTGVRPWEELLQEAGARVADHPFRCDHAALHHVLDEGWMWQLRFDNGVTSLGFALDAASAPAPAEGSPRDEWSQLLERYPSIRSQLADAKLAAPPAGLQRTGRVQRCCAAAAGSNWALLPHTAGFVDPLHSTGIAHTLCGVERLAAILERCWSDPDKLGQQLQAYSATTLSEIGLIDELVSAGYQALPVWRMFVAASMLYFAAATTYERRRHEGRGASAYLCADDEPWRRIVAHVRRRLARLMAAGPVASDAASFEDEVAKAIRPYNSVGLCDPAAFNLYRYTAAPK